MKIDLTAAIATTEELLTALRDLNGTEQDQTPTRQGQRQRTQINRTLMYMAHLSDKVRIQIMDQFFAAQNRDDQVRPGSVVDDPEVPAR